MSDLQLVKTTITVYGREAVSCGGGEKHIPELGGCKAFPCSLVLCQPIESQHL